MKNKIHFVSILFSIFSLAALLGYYPKLAQAQVPSLNPTQQAQLQLEEDQAAATAAAETTEEASPAAKVEEKIKEKQAEDITETTGEQKSKLAAFLDQHPIGKLTWHNFLQHAIRSAIDKGLPANIIVLLLLFPTIAALIAGSRHVIGLRGFGIYIPAVLSVAFVSTEILTGSIVFLAVLFAAIVSHKIVKKLRFPYLPRTSMILWGVSIIILGLLIVSSHLAFFELLTINIFPILILILLTENFMSSQLFSSQKESLRTTLETMIIAIICSLIINQEIVQQFVLLRPEITLLATAILNFLIANYTGLRLLEMIRFKTILADQHYQYQYPAQDDQSE